MVEKICCLLLQELPEEIFTFQGKIQLENADRDYHLLEYYKHEPIEPAVKPVMVYFGQWVSQTYYPTLYIQSNCLFCAMSWVTELLTSQ